MYSSNRSSSFQEEIETATGLPEDVEKLLTCPVCLDVSFILLNITLHIRVSYIMYMIGCFQTLTVFVCFFLFLNSAPDALS